MLTFREDKVSALRGYFDQQALTKRMAVQISYRPDA
jgi:hypothetical protein